MRGESLVALVVGGEGAASLTTRYHSSSTRQNDAIPMASHVCLFCCIIILHLMYCVRRHDGYEPEAMPAVKLIQLQLMRVYINISFVMIMYYEQNIR